MNQILVVEDEPVIRGALNKLLTRYGHSVVEAESVEAASELPLHDMALIISDLRLPGAEGTDMIALAAPTPVLIMTSYASLRSAVDAMKLGAVDYIAKPFNHDEMVMAVERILKEQQQGRLTRAMSADLARNYPTTEIIAESGVMTKLLGQIDKLAPEDTPLLLVGESGTGKELLARTIHQRSERADGPLVTFNCSAIGSDLQADELFGCVTDDSTGQTARRGLIEDAHGGTLFVDDINELTADTQARLLQLLDQGENLRVGATQGTAVDVRLIAASQRPLQPEVEASRFRQDLYYRIKGAKLVIPALRDRQDDILPLANALLSRSVERLNSQDCQFSQEASDAMTQYRWPGNIRELGNAVERAIILAEDAVITPDLLGIAQEAVHTTPKSASHEELSLKDYFTRFVLENQDTMTETALARKLGISRKCLWERRQRFDLPRKKKS